MKSTTCPRANPGSRKRRSSRWVVAPPSTSPNATAQARDVTRRATTVTATTAAAANTAKIQVYAEPIENAAPGL